MMMMMIMMILVSGLLLLLLLLLAHPPHHAEDLGGRPRRDGLGGQLAAHGVRHALVERQVARRLTPAAAANPVTAPTPSTAATPLRRIDNIQAEYIDSQRTKIVPRDHDHFQDNHHHPPPEPPRLPTEAGAEEHVRHGGPSRGAVRDRGPCAAKWSVDAWSACASSKWATKRAYSRSWPSSRDTTPT
jgi:hypothetical protein